MKLNFIGSNIMKVIIGDLDITLSLVEIIHLKLKKHVTKLIQQSN